MAQGITINGLPLMMKRPSYATTDIDDLDVYYEDCVIGGPGAFMIPVRDRASSRGDPDQAGAGNRRLRAAGALHSGGRDAAHVLHPRASGIWQERWGN